VWGRERADKKGRVDRQGGQGIGSVGCGVGEAPRGSQAGEAGGKLRDGGMLLDAGKEGGPSSPHPSSLARTTQGGVAQGARRVGSLWEEALEAQKRGEAAFLRRQAAREEAVTS
jgi:hypothetical protein